MPDYRLFAQPNSVIPALNQEDDMLIRDISAVTFHDGSGIDSLRRAYAKLIVDGYINEVSIHTLNVIDETLARQERVCLPYLYPTTGNLIARSTSSPQYGNQRTERELYDLYSGLIQAVQGQIERRAQLPQLGR